MYENLAILAVLVFLYSIASARFERTPINGALMYIAFGLALGPLGLGVLSMDKEGLRTLAELTLALVLFTDAARIDLVRVRQDHNLPVRMLVIGLPLVIIFGTVIGAQLFPQFTLWEAALLAA